MNKKSAVFSAQGMYLVNKNATNICLGMFVNKHRESLIFFPRAKKREMRRKCVAKNTNLGGKKSAFLII